MGRSPHGLRARLRATTEKAYEAHTYVVGREKVREYAAATGETHPIYHDPFKANAAGFADVVAALVHALVFASGPMMHAIFHPEGRNRFAGSRAGRRGDHPHRGSRDRPLLESMAC
jgi:hypothetical protein